MLVHLSHQRTQPVVQQTRVINDDVPLAFIRLVNAENLRAYRRFDLFRHLAIDEVLHRPLFPVRIKHVAVEAFVFFADIKAILRAGGELLQLFQQPVRVHFGRHNPGARFHRAVTGNQFIITNRDLNVVENIRRRFCPTQNDRFAFRLLMAFGVEQRTFKRDFTRAGEQCVFQALNTIRHD
ncbi:hypothetical protein D3C72_1238870 [compost metagenome]